MSYDTDDFIPCAHCGKEPLIVNNTRVDACFKGALLGGAGVSGCCGHGDRAKAYVRLEVIKPDGERGSVDLCGFWVIPYGSYIGHLRRSDYPALNAELS